MNRSELAELLATTHGHLSDQQSQHSANTKVPSANGPSPLSPRQIFQSRVRTLSDNGSTSPQRSPNRRRGELQRLSTLRVHITSPGSNSHAYHTRDGRFDFTSHEPDFIAEERAAWTGASIGRVGARPGADDASLRLSEDSERLADNADLVPLQAFAPSLDPAESDERPKTSRGSSMPGTFPRPQSEPSPYNTPARKSKFFEGSMNDRSVGVSSSWQHHGERLSTDQSSTSNDSDSTPRAAHMSTESLDSEDLAEFKPAAATPATLKQRLSRLANPFRASEESTEATDQVEKQPKKKRLRKSISSWNFHNLGDKVKFFGASASDSSGVYGQTPKAATTEQLDVLTERKRKAEETYAEQFGTKKQKTNYGISAEDRSRTVRGPPRTLKKRAVSTSRTPTTRRQRDVSASTIVPTQDPADISKPESVDLRKRPSRRELEKENQQLRVLLREQQVQSRACMQLSASRSSLHLPRDEHDQMGEWTQATNPPASHVEPRAKRVQKRHERAGIPPVPPLPPREVLATLGNKPPTDPDTFLRMKNAAPWESTGTVKRVTRSMKLQPPKEEDVENIEPKATNSVPRVEWQWPEDVF